MESQRLKSIPSSVFFPKVEEEVLEFWKEDDTFQKSLDKNRQKPPYVFYDGPPFATGLPHYGHILTSYIKDTIPRYFTMKGRFVDRTWGWDCHGLPVEYEVEKSLNISGKQEIEGFGIDRFNDACRNIVLRYAAEWERIVHRIGRWVDFSRQYRTMDLPYMESILWAFSELYKREMIYESMRVVGYCNRCQTPLSNFEAGLDDSFREREDPAITVRFPDADDPDSSFLAWTTTPWTLPGNVALAVNNDIEYVLVKPDSGERLWMAAERISDYRKVLGAYVTVKTVKGSELVGKKYLAPFDFVKDSQAFRILHGDFVDTGAGTGIVHLAPRFGEDDFIACSASGINGFDPVGTDGRFTEAAPLLTGMDVFEANKHIIDFLKHSGRLFHREQYRHNYPHCWRCDNPLIYRAISSWFVRVSRFRDRMVTNNKKINWVPEHIRDGRFGLWLADAKDWSISRNRYWGSPIPIWKCDGCGEVFVPSCLGDLEEKTQGAVTDLHRPYCDMLTWNCLKLGCSGTFERVPEVLDCWFESGGMPYGQAHFPFENKRRFEENFPASFIVEYISQTRGWFYTLVVEATALLDSHPFENAICHGVILAEDGRKMSKRLKNFPDPEAVVNQHGSDALRIYLLSSPVVKGQDIRFSEKGVHEAVRRYLLPLWNAFHFFTSYAALAKGYEPRLMDAALRAEDRYIVSELETLRMETTRAVEAYDLPGCYRRILSFIETLSGWHIRINRNRFWVEEIDEDSSAAFNTLYTVLLEGCLIAAPFIPFTTEYLYRHLTGESVHLADWPPERPQRIDKELAQETLGVRKVVEGVRRIREKNRIRLRQPLGTLHVAGLSERALKEHQSLILSQTNVKEVKAHDRPDAFAKREVRLNPKVAGRFLGANFKAVQTAVENGQFVLEESGRVQAGGQVLEKIHYSIQWKSFSRDEETWSDREDLVLSLSLAITDELRTEGVARELNRLIQDQRKQMKLAYETRIDLLIEASGDWQRAFSTHRDWLMEQILGENVSGNVPEPMLKRNDERGELSVAIVPHP